MAESAVYLQARVIQKVATEAEWQDINLDPLIDGELYLYRDVDGTPRNFKIGDGVNQPRDIPYFFDASIRVPFFGTATPSSVPDPATGSGFWIATEAGTYTNYGGVELPANSFGIITRVGTTYGILIATIDLSGYVPKSSISVTTKQGNQLDYSSNIVTGYVISTGTVSDYPNRNSIKELDIQGNSYKYLHIKGLTGNGKNLAFLNNSNAMIGSIVVVNTNPFTVQIPSSNAYKINLTIKYDPSDSYQNLRLVITDTSTVPDDLIESIGGTKLKADALSDSILVKNPTADYSPTPKIYVDSNFLSNDQVGVVIGQQDLSDKTENKSFPNAAVTYIINKTVTQTSKIKKLRLNGVVSGDMLIAKYTLNGGTAVRIGFQSINIPVGITDVLVTDIITLEPGEYFGISYNKTTALARVGFKTQINNDYGYYQINVNVSTGSAVGALLTDGYFGIDFEVYAENSLYGDLVSLVDSKTQSIQYPSIDSGVIQITNDSSKRNDNASIIRLNDGALIACWGNFVGEITDHSQAFLKIKKSIDNGLNWQDYSRIAITGQGNYIPSFYRKTTGIILMVYLVKLAPISGIPVSYIAMRTSSDEGLSWSAETAITSTTNGQYLVIAAHRLYKTSTALFMPYSLLTSGNGNSTTSTYEGRLLRSNDEGTTWFDTGASISAPDQIFVEGGIYQTLSGSLAYYFRTRTGKAKICFSTNGGTSFGPLQDMFDAPNSMLSVIRLRKNNLFIAVANDLIGDGEGNPSRQNLIVYKSSDGVNFTQISNLYAFRYDGEYSVFEPILYEDRFTNGLYVVYTRTFSSIYDLVFTNINFEKILY